MIQKKYFICGAYTMAEMIRDIQQDPAYAAASERALLVFESENNLEDIQAHLDTLAAELPETKVFGMTLLGKLKADMILAENATICSLLLFESSRVQVVGADTADMPAKTAAEDFLKQVDRQDLKGILFLTGVK